ncbi:MAG: aminotransferase class I/II-fold pyridoxal phosphate-dependent enzyme [Nitrososphaeraceae archaeon]|nr:aminotransferase class I/II-fold pyridoxal phosphate-dependent enzyme [Nitrososphaeraceae archaeon]
MVSKYDHIYKQLESYKEKNIYRELLISSIKKKKGKGDSGNSFYLGNKKAINLCSNDYLGLSQNPLVISITKGSLKQISQCSSRLISGNDKNIIKLESILAKHRNTKRALVYPTGYMANLGAITSLSSPDHVIFSDSLNHASIIDSCRLARSNAIEIFRHNDIEHLSLLFKKNSKFKKIIVTEGVFSMDGDIARLNELSELAKKYDAILVVDDAHSDFIFGRSGNYGGIPEYYGVEKQVDIHISSLSKGLGCFGGYVASSELVYNFLINRSRQFIYTSAIPEHLCVAAMAAIHFLKKNKNIQKDFISLINWFRDQLKESGFNVGNSASQIIPIIVGNEKLALDFSKELFKNGIFIQAIRYPTVSVGEARLRISINASFSKPQLLYVIKCLDKIAKKMGIT